MARPQKEINWDVVDKLIEAGCSAREIAAKFHVNRDTFYNRFKDHHKCCFQDYHDKTAEAGLADIRSMLQAKAINNSAPGNTTLLIFLARCRLGMREPDIIQHIAPNQDKLDQSHLIMELQHKIAELESKYGLDKN
jgi:hypothetical protein